MYRLVFFWVRNHFVRWRTPSKNLLMLLKLVKWNERKLKLTYVWDTKSPSRKLLSKRIQQIATTESRSTRRQWNFSKALTNIRVELWSKCGFNTNKFQFESWTRAAAVFNRNTASYATAILFAYCKLTGDCTVQSLNVGDICASKLSIWNRFCYIFVSIIRFEASIRYRWWNMQNYIETTGNSLNSSLWSYRNVRNHRAYSHECHFQTHQNYYSKQKIELLLSAPFCCVQAHFGARLLYDTVSNWNCWHIKQIALKFMHFFRIWPEPIRTERTFATAMKWKTQCIREICWLENC